MEEQGIPRVMGYDKLIGTWSWALLLVSYMILIVRYDAYIAELESRLYRRVTEKKKRDFNPAT